MKNGAKRRFAFLGVVVGMMGAAPAVAGNIFMTTTGPTRQPIGYFDFCKSHADECGVTSPESVRVRLTPGLRAELNVVNAVVNKTIKPVTDQEAYGTEEFWTYPMNSRGDCEDFVLLKRRDLIEKGWPVGALLMTMVRQKNGEGHLVLTVLTDEGDLVLDNLSRRVLVWNVTGYRYVKRQSEVNTGLWVTIDEAPLSSVGSVEAH